MEDLTKHYLISGRVQGVGYRAFTRRQGEELKLKGWVRNLVDGRVEAVAKGSEVLLKEFEAQLRRGPPAGHIESLQVTVWEENLPLSGFEVRKDGAKPCAKE
jgi:acylphosphatase